MTKYVKAELINYFDVWAEFDGENNYWQVNNLCSEGYVGVPENCTDEELLEALKRKGFLKKSVTLKQLEFEDFYPFIEIVDVTNDYYPLGRLEFKDL